MRPPPESAVPEYRVLLGQLAGRWVAAPPQMGALVLGPPRSGKTSGVIVPNVMAWPGPVLATSTRREVLDACAPARSRRGAVACFDPLGAIGALPPGVERLHWSPLRGCAAWDVAVARARALTAGAGRGVEHADHWHTRSAQLLAALLHAAARHGRSMSTVVDWVNGHDHETALRLLDELPDRHGAEVLAGVARTAERERSSIWSTASATLSAFDNHAVLASADAAGTSRFDAAGVLAGAHSVFVIAPSDGGVDLAPLVVGLVEELRAAAVRSTDRAGPLERPLLLALDEVANICPLPSLPQVASEGGGRNIVLLMALQDLSQAATRWGREQAGGLLTLAGAKLVLPGIADVDTLRRLESLAGTRWVPNVSTTAAPSGRLFPFSTRNRHTSAVELPRFAAAAIRQLPAGHALAIVGSEPAAAITLAAYHRSEPFVRWAGLEVAPVPPGARSPFGRCDAVEPALRPALGTGEVRHGHDELDEPWPGAGPAR